MGEVATWSMIRSKISSFPAPTSGRGNECLTKSEIISMGGNGVEVSGSYGNQETVVLDNIGAVTWEYTLSASVSSLSFAGAGGTKSFTVTSTKQKKVNGVNSGSPVNVGYSNSVSGSGFSISGNSVTVGKNTSSLKRNGSITIKQNESIKKITINLSQAAGGPIYNDIYLFIEGTNVHAIPTYAPNIDIEIGVSLIYNDEDSNEDTAILYLYEGQVDAYLERWTHGLMELIPEYCYPPAYNDHEGNDVRVNAIWRP